MTPERVIELLQLAPHPEEGGYFRETFRSAETCDPGGAYAGPRSAGTAIYYLLTAGSFSAMHRLPGAEVFHFYTGDPVEMLLLHPAGTSEVVTLGPDLETMQVQFTVPGAWWQGSRLAPGGRWALLGTTMSPGFDYQDYETGTRALAAAYPDRAAMIEARLR